MEQVKACPKCQTPNGLESLFCMTCGTRLSPADGLGPVAQSPLPVLCPYCGSSNPPGAARCPKCGWGFVGTAVAVPPPSSSTSPATPIGKLGIRLDGWADLVEGAGAKSANVGEALEAELKQRKMPRVTVSHEDLTPGGLAGKHRSYRLARSYTGATVAAYVGEFGRDLYVSWDLYLRPIVKLENIMFMIGAAGLLALFQAVDTNRYSGTQFSGGIWMAATIGWSIIIGLGALIAGRVLRGSAMAFLMEEIDTFSADDVAAMSFVVHKSLLKALDAVGLDASLLRRKEAFVGGRRERVI